MCVCMLDMRVLYLCMCLCCIYVICCVCVCYSKTRYNELQGTRKTLRNNGSSLYCYYEFMVIYFKIRYTVQ